MSDKRKACTKCGEDKPLGDFYSRGGGRLASACKVCCLEQKRQRHAANPSAAAESGRKYRQAHKERVSAAKRAWYEANKRRVSERKRAWVEENRDRIREQRRAYRQRNAEVIAERQRQYGAENREAIRLNKRAYAEKNKERMREKWLLEKTYRLGAVPVWDVELTELVTLEAARLARLRADVVGGKWHVDHFIPLRGRNVCGLHVWSNLSVVPAEHNLRKSNKLLLSASERSWL